jgi:hypothetical protein
MVQPSSPDILLDLLVPLVLELGRKPVGKLKKLIPWKLLNGNFDFFNRAHGSILQSQALGSNRVIAKRCSDAFLGDQRFRFDDEADGVEFHLRAPNASFVHQPKRWRDAYFAAFALTADAELVTFDSGFRSFAGLRYRILVP